MSTNDPAPPANRPRLDFFVIGAARCGTTSLFSLLLNHPAIYRCPVKEPRFFNAPGKKGWDWYRSLYDPAPADQLRGDFSPSYSNSPKLPAVPRRIAAAYPEARIVYIVRNPIDCVLSNWRMKAQKFGPIGFRESLDEWAKGLLHRSLFWKQISLYRHCFADRQILVLQLERLVTDQAGQIERLCRFLGIDPSGSPKFLHINASGAKPDRPGIPLTTLEDRRYFIDLVADDALQMLDYIGAPLDSWDLSSEYCGWDQSGSGDAAGG
ncbi:MAG: sulfotransferase [Parasphingopyxis sp.]|nr:sulfotransferase domain-containing protein [Sphingomonadales bacterium]